MADLARALKEEIRRLARKEIKAETGNTKQAVAQYRREIASLKRKVAQQQKKIAFLEDQEKKRLEEPEAVEVAEGVITGTAAAARCSGARGSRATIHSQGPPGFVAGRAVSRTRAPRNATVNQPLHTAQGLKLRQDFIGRPEQANPKREGFVYKGTQLVTETETVLLRLPRVGDVIKSSVDRTTHDITVPVDHLNVNDALQERLG